MDLDAAQLGLGPRQPYVTAATTETLSAQRPMILYYLEIKARQML